MLMKRFGQDDRLTPEDVGARRRLSNLVKGWSHWAILTYDMEATRHFWENVLGMPLVASLVGDEDWTHGTKANFLHCFFELADGSAVAFFQFEEGAREERFEVSRDAYDLHIALGVEGMENLLSMKQRLLDNGVELVNEIDHGICYSIYTHDPNGMSVEFTTALPNSYEMMEVEAQKAHTIMDEWLALNARRKAEAGINA